MKRLLLFFVIPLISGCQLEIAPAWFVPGDARMSVYEGESRTFEVLSELGYAITAYHPEDAIIETAWQYGTSLQSRRRRALLRLKKTRPFGVTVAMPVESFDGVAWVPTGDEDETSRQVLVASLTARLQPEGGSRRR